MSTYKKYESAEEGYRIQFSFLKGIGEAISAIVGHNELLALLNASFSQVVISKGKSNISNSESGTIEEHLFNELRKLMGNRHLSGAEIRKLLSTELTQFATLSASEKASYVRTKKRGNFRCI